MSLTSYEVFFKSYTGLSVMNVTNLKEIIGLSQVIGSLKFKFCRNLREKMPPRQEGPLLSGGQVSLVQGLIYCNKVETPQALSF